MGGVSKEMAELLEKAQMAILKAIPDQVDDRADKALYLANAWAILQERKPREVPPAKSVQLS